MCLLVFISKDIFDFPFEVKVNRWSHSIWCFQSVAFLVQNAISTPNEWPFGV